MEVERDRHLSIQSLVTQHFSEDYKTLFAEVQAHKPSFRGTDDKKQENVNIKKDSLSVKMPLEEQKIMLINFMETGKLLLYAMTMKHADTHVNIWNCSKSEGKPGKLEVCIVQDNVTCIKLGVMKLHFQSIICLFIGLDKGTLFCHTFGNIGTHFQLQLFGQAITHFALPDNCQQYDGSNLLAVGGSKGTIMLVNCQKRCIVVYLEKMGQYLSSPVDLFFFKKSRFILHAFDDGFLRLWAIDQQIITAIEDPYDKKSRVQVPSPCYKTRAPCQQFINAIQPYLGMLMILDKNNLLKLVHLQPSIEDCYILVSKYQFPQKQPISHMQTAEKHEYVLVSSGCKIYQVMFSDRGPQAVTIFNLEGNYRQIGWFMLGPTEQQYFAGLVDSRFFITKSNKFQRLN